MLLHSLRHKPDLWIFAFGIVLLVGHIVWQPQRLAELQPVDIKQFSLTMTYDGHGEDVSVTTYVPQNLNRQTVLSQLVEPGPLDYRLEETESGLVANWEGEDIQGRHQIAYRASLSMQGLQYEVPNNIAIPISYPPALDIYLAETESVQVSHPEISQLWEKIKPDDDSNLLAVLQTIYQYTYGLETVPFKGLTDAVTALRLQQASCNGKSRLFVALARLNNIPARLVGGVILDGGRKKTSHQWLEVYVERHWVPMGPTNGYFAELPANYLSLYFGDEVLFSHTRNINFEYWFDITGKRVASGVQAAMNSPQQRDKLNLAALLSNLGMDERTASIFLLFPLCALCITFFRNVVGVQSFGIFMPMLIAAACRYTGLWLGLIAFIAVMAVAFGMHRVLEKARLLKIPRLAAVITVVTIAFLALIAAMDVTQNRIELGIVALFPVVIIAFTAERLQHMIEDNNWRDALYTSLGTGLLILLCYGLFSSLFLRGVFALFPALFVLVLGLQIFIGRWTGVRVGEFWRFKHLIRSGEGELMTMNARNRDWVMGKNDKQWMNVANDKLQSKKRLSEFKIPVPDTVCEYHSRLDCQHLSEDIKNLNSFVVKPNNGSRGQGILVVNGRNETTWFSAGGKALSEHDISRHVQEILAGTFSAMGRTDQAFIEPLLRQHSELNEIADFGLSDIRIVLSEGHPLACMWRVPTKDSDGKANLHQGAIGVAIDTESGLSVRAERNGESIQIHPDTQADLIGVQLPFWQDILSMSKRCYKAIPLAYLGVDICIDNQLGPLVLEVNARPGLEIQNVKGRGLRDLFLLFENNHGSKGLSSDNAGGRA